jgi:hypothetical protein
MLSGYTIEGPHTGAIPEGLVIQISYSSCAPLRTTASFLEVIKGKIRAECSITKEKMTECSEN